MTTQTKSSLATRQEVFNQSSSSISVATIALALDGTLDFLKLKDGLQAKTDLQAELLALYYQLKPILNQIKKDENISVKADISEIPLNKFLIDNGFEIQLDKIEDGFGVVALFRAKGKHAKHASLTTFTDITGTTHHNLGVEFNDLQFDESTNTFVSFSKDMKYKIMFTPVDESYQGLSLYKKSLDIVRNTNRFLSSKTLGYDAVVIPAFDFSEKPDIKPLLVGMNIGLKHYIAQALQENQFKFSDKGFEAASATAIAIERFAMVQKNKYIIDGSFIASFATNTLGVNDLPLLSVQINKDTIKLPEISGI